jgi:hypothetical protein
MTVAQYIKKTWIKERASDVLERLDLGLKRKQLVKITVEELWQIAELLEITPGELLDDIEKYG